MDSSIDEKWIRGLELKEDTSEGTTIGSRSKGPVRRRQLGVWDGRPYIGNDWSQKKKIFKHLI